MSNGPITKSSPAGGTGLRVAGLALLAQAGLRGFFLARLLLALSRYPRLLEVYPPAWSIVFPAIFVVCGAVSGLLLLARSRVAATLAAIFCVLGLLFQGFAAMSIAVTYSYSSHHPATPTYALMAMNMLIYVGTLIAVVRSA